METTVKETHFALRPWVLELKDTRRSKIKVRTSEKLDGADGGTLICTIENQDGNSTTIKVARLIAAAPEMKQALEDLLGFCKNRQPGEPTGFSFDQAETLLKRLE